MWPVVAEPLSRTHFSLFEIVHDEYTTVCAMRTLLGLQFRVGDSWAQITWNLIGLPPKTGLTPLGPQSRFGDKAVKFYVGSPQNGTAVFKRVGKKKLGAIVNRTYGTHKKLHVFILSPITCGPIYYRPP